MLFSSIQLMKARKQLCSIVLTGLPLRKTKEMFQSCQHFGRFDIKHVFPLLQSADRCWHQEIWLFYNKWSPTILKISLKGQKPVFLSYVGSQSWAGIDEYPLPDLTLTFLLPRPDPNYFPKFQGLGFSSKRLFPVTESKFWLILLIISIDRCFERTF